MWARAHVSGLVQGVGFRPFVWRAATTLGLSGWVSNDAAGAVLEVEGAPADVAALLAALTSPPPLARVDAVRREPVPVCAGAGFEVRISDATGARLAQVSPDTATCADCLIELADAGDRRFGDAFVNCTNRGPQPGALPPAGASMPSVSWPLRASNQAMRELEFRNVSRFVFIAAPRAGRAGGNQSEHWSRAGHIGSANLRSGNGFGDAAAALPSYLVAEEAEVAEPSGLA